MDVGHACSVTFSWMKSRVALDLNLRAIRQHLLGVDVFLLTPRIGWGAALKPKSRAMRFHIHKKTRKVLIAS